MWAWRSLSPKCALRRRRAYGTRGVTKAIVLMTDGVNEMIDSSNNATDYNTATISVGAYAAISATRASAVANPAGRTRMAFPTYTALASFYDKRLLRLLNIKAKGVQIYRRVQPAGFLTSAQQTAAANLLQQCASVRTNAFIGDNASLNTAFQTIAASAVAGSLKSDPQIPEPTFIPARRSPAARPGFHFTDGAARTLPESPRGANGDPGSVPVSPRPLWPGFPHQAEPTGQKASVGSVFVTPSPRPTYWSPGAGAMPGASRMVHARPATPTPPRGSPFTFRLSPTRDSVTLSRAPFRPERALRCVRKQDFAEGIHVLPFRVDPEQGS